MAAGRGDRIGEGRMTIAELKPHELVGVRAEFIKPMAATHQVRFELHPAAGGGTSVTWEMRGSNSFSGKAFSLFVNLDRLIGSDFERGLAELKRVSETPDAAQTAASTAAR